MKPKDWSQNEYTYMAEAIRLARKGFYTTDPNPRVGCVIVKGGKVVGRGWHKKAGDNHAEVNALGEAGVDAKNSEVYVSLEPCSHDGRTPPCAKGLIEAGVSRVVAATKDPNPRVCGKGFKILKEAGIEVASGLLAEQARDLNLGFFKRMTCQRPWIRLKIAISLDGRTAMDSGESQWITGPAARSDVQRYRARSSAVLTGVGTVLHDDAVLTVRADELGIDDAETVAGRQPLRVILDSNARIGAQANLFAQPGPILWGVSDQAEVPEKLANLQHVEVVRLPSRHSREYLGVVLDLLAKRGCNELLVEAGATLVGTFLQQGLWDELVVYMAPVLMGSEARALANLPLQSMTEVKSLKLKDMRMIGDDIRLIYSPIEPTDF